MKSINIYGKLLHFDTPKIMGIINLTPDSFHADSRQTDLIGIIPQIEKMLSEGADIIDIGAVSTRPNAQEISADEEKRRLFSVLPELCKQFPDTIFSIDTYRAEVAQEAVNCGVGIINDVSGGLLDESMVETIAKLQVPYVLMHMRGTPQTMGTLTQYDKFPEDVIAELAQQYHRFRQAGVNDIIIDPGFGFAKTIEQNFALFNTLEQFNCFSAPLLLGISRKKTIQKTLNVTAEEALNGTTFMHAIALQKGADILRVHDVKEAVECVKLFKQLKVEN